MKKILITGATGYIGRRLKDRLIKNSDYSIRLFVRNKSKVRAKALEHVEIVEGDTFSRHALMEALDGVDTAFYLIHSMGAGIGYDKRDQRSAKNFWDACIDSGVRRVVYLGGLGVRETASKHLLSRIETGKIISSRPDKFQTIWFRAGVIIGAGSASFEIIRNLVEKVPVMLTPSWVSTRTQPIAIDDVLSYLEAAIELEAHGNLVVDIGTEAMSFKEMLDKTADVMELDRNIIPIPFLTPRLSSLGLVLLTPVPYQIASELIEGLKSETIIQNNNADKFFGHIKPMPFKEAILAALEEIDQNEVISRWCDSSADEYCDIKDHADPSSAILRDHREFPYQNIPQKYIFESISSLGGDMGWFAYNSLWRIRGVIDKLYGGYGLNRGRRVHGRLRLGDALDFWKVVDIRENKRVLLLAQMKLPGKAWLEFDIQEDKLVQTAHFHPHGLMGRIYWGSILPMHHLIFDELGRKLLEHAEALTKERSSGHGVAKSF